MIHSSIKFGALVAFICLSSCAKKMTETAQLEKLPRVKEKDLIDALDSISVRKPDFFYTKVDTHFTDTTQEVNFKTSIRIKVDSAINAIITYAKIPIVTTMVTLDSVKISNKRDKCFILEDLDYFKTTFGIDFSYYNIQELLLGMPLDYDIEEKYFQIHDPYHYIISTHRKSAMRRNNNIQRNRDDEDFILKYYISEDLSRLNKFEIESIEDEVYVTVEYLSYQEDKGFRVPKVVRLNIVSPKNHVVIEMEYDKAEINEPRELFFDIPESYEKCK